MKFEEVLNVINQQILIENRAIEGKPDEMQGNDRGDFVFVKDSFGEKLFYPPEPEDAVWWRDLSFYWTGGITFGVRNLIKLLKDGSIKLEDIELPKAKGN